MTLVEVMIAFSVLVLTSVGGVSGFVLLNRYAENNRNLSMARSLCQERIEQAQTLPYGPMNSVPSLPSAPSSDPKNTTACTILGTTSNYTTTAYNGGNNLQTSSETIPIYTQTTGAAASNSPAVTYTRTTTLTPLGMNNASGTSLNLLQFTVTVSYVYRGQKYTTSMVTLRGPD